MLKSILQFLELEGNKFESTSEFFFENPKSFTDYIVKAKNEAFNMLTFVFAKEFEEMDDMIRRSGKRKKNWVIVRRDETSLISSVGQIRYHKTLFKNKANGECCYLLDKMMELEPHERITADAIGQMLEEATESSYRKGGEKTSLTDIVSKETVKEKIHELEFPKIKSNMCKKKVDNLYVSADEDHVSLQFFEKKGDITVNENGLKYNSCLSKLVYVYEGRVPERPVSGSEKPRWKLKNAKYFSGVYEGSKNRELWEEVRRYIEDNYELSEGGHIFITSDGGPWIECAEEVLGEQAVHVLDKFHMNEYVNKAVSHMGDSRGDAKDCIMKAISLCSKKELERCFDILEDFAVEEDIYKRVITAKRYLISNWKKIKKSGQYKEYLHGCSAEGHVSHILSDRLSSRPLGWSKTGVDKVSKLRAYRANGGDMYELAKYQRHPEKAEYVEELKCSSKDILVSEHGYRRMSDKYYEIFNKTIEGSSARKQVIFAFGFNPFV